MRRLLIRPGAIGDFVLSLPELESLRADYTEVWCASANVPLARFCNTAISIGTSGIDRLGILNDEDVIERLRTFDDIVSWYGANRPEFRELVDVLSLPFRFFPAFSGRAVGIPRLTVPPLKRTFAVVHPFASSTAKRASIQWFQAMAERVSKTMATYWLAGPEEELADAVRIPDLYDLACWLAGARIFIGNDSGISHLAAAVGTPVLVAFKQSDVRIWAPRGTTWMIKQY